MGESRSAKNRVRRLLDLERLRFVPGLGRHIRRVNQGRHAIYLDYPVDPSPRYGWGSPPHGRLQDLISTNRSGYSALLDELETFAPGLREIPVAEPLDAGGPHWMNGFVQGLDLATLYAFPKRCRSSRYFACSPRRAHHHAIIITPSSRHHTPRPAAGRVASSPAFRVEHTITKGAPSKRHWSKNELLQK